MFFLQLPQTLTLDMGLVEKTNLLKLAYKYAGKHHALLHKWLIPSYHNIFHKI